MEEYISIIFRTLFLYILITVVFRMMGKREIGELSILDLVVFIMIAEMAVVSIEDTEKPLFNTILPMFVLLFIQILTAIISLKSQRFRDLVEGKPSVLINQGNIDEREMKKQRYNLDDLLVQLREKEIKNVGDVEFAVLEPTGKLSVFEKDKSQSDDQDENYLFPFPVIMDGKVQERQLEKIGKTNLWLRQKLRELGYRDVKNIMLCSIHHDESLYVEEKDGK